MKYPNGLPLLRLPVTARHRSEERRRDLQDLGSLTASAALERTAVAPDGPIACCGSKNRFAELLRALARRSSLPFVLVGTQKDMDSGCLPALEPEWTAKSISTRLKSGSGALVLDPGNEDIHLALMDALPKWRDHLVILCLGGGLQLDLAMLDQLNTLGTYVLLCDPLGRSVRGTDGSRLTPVELLRAMDYLLISSAGLSAGELLEVLPTYQSERISNTVDLSTRRPETHPRQSRGCGLDRGGLGMSQARTLEEKPLVTQDELRAMQRSGRLLVHNARSSMTWNVKIR